MEQSFFNTVKDILGSPDGLKSRVLFLGKKKIVLFFMAELTDPIKVFQSVVTPINIYDDKIELPLDRLLAEKILFNQEIASIKDEDDAIEKLLKGKVIIEIGGKPMLAVDCEYITGRAITEPPTSAVLKGPRDGFVESVKKNLALIRQRLPCEELKMKSLTVGKYTKSTVFVLHMDKIADKKIVKEVIDRLSLIDIDGIVDSSYLSAFLTPRKKSMFKQVGTCEKPDVLVAKLLEGRIGIIVDGSPIALTLPFTLFEDLQNSDDYYGSKSHASFIRVIRFIGIIVAMLLPGMYVALQLFHYKIIPTDFLVSIINTTQGIPFTPMAEIVFIIVLFEILYDASLRMPRYLGLALSVVGALILGDTAVKAGLVSPPSVMIVALSGLTFYTMPDQAAQLSELRLLFVLVGSVLGIFGILLLVLYLIIVLCDMDSYGGSYLAPIAPYVKSDMKDFILKSDLTQMKSRPHSVNKSSENRTRLNNEKN